MSTRTTRFRQGKIDPQHWDRLKTILGEALEQNSSAARIALVERCCGEDTDLLEEAESLLAEAEALLNERTDSFEDCAQNAASTFWEEGPPRTGQRLGAYVIVRELGCGGMGTVFLAERADGQFEKQVAIKILNRGADTAEILRRFRAERQILARLDHPNIARLLDAGTTDDGLPYFIMDYIVGAPVTRFAVAQKLSTPQRLELFLKICAAVEFAHRNLVVHRDIKPSNILANAEGEPKLLDFGIAKLLAKDEDAEQLTAETQQHLTPICASPEQAKGDPITFATDIYSLGTLLYEMLSDQKPHRFSTARPSREELALVVGEQVPPPPSAVTSDARTARLLRGDLDAIVLLAMRKEPELRYATAADLAEDIRRHLARKPVVACYPTLSLQILGDRVRINAQLIDTRTDTQIWAEQYDRKLEDIFALQSELAQTIAGQLKATLSTGEKAEIWKQPTQDLQAYDLYLRARAALRAGSGILPRENLNVAIDLLNRAIARDPKFTLAYCLLNEAYVLQYRYGEDHSPQHLAAAKEAAETALRLEPSREEARLALARYYYHGLSDYRRTAQELSSIPSTAPHEVEFFTLASLVERRLGQFAASIRDGEKAIELDPQDVWLAACLSQTYSGLRQFRDAERVANAAIARRRGAKSTGLLVLKSEAALAMGNLEEAHAGLDSIHDKDDVNYQATRLRLYLIERDYSGAKAFGANASDELKKTPNFWLTLAAIAHADGNVNEERQAYAEAKRLALLALVPRPDNPRLLGELAIAEAGLGENEEALRHSRRAAEILSPSVDAVEGAICEMNLAAVLVMIGDRDATFDKLTKLVKLPFGVINYGDLKLDPVWDDLRGDRRFDRILAESALPLATND